MAKLRYVMALFAFLGADSLLASGDLALPGASLSLLWALPFAGTLLSLAICPLVVPGLWHHHYGKVMAFWALTICAGLLSYGWQSALYELLHLTLMHYIPFVVLVGALYTIAGGLRVTLNVPGTPAMNTLILFLGALAAGVMGTTGAAMLFIKPILDINEGRASCTHTIIFFIFIVCNVGGALSTLGDPPLFLGFLSGVDFFWPTQHLWPETLAVLAALLVMYWAIDTWQFSKHGYVFEKKKHVRLVSFAGKRNFYFLAGAVALVLMSGFWKSGITFTVFHVHLALQDIIRDTGLLALIYASWRFGPKDARHANHFSWGPFEEVAKLFIAIFITAAPVIAILKAGEAGALSSIVQIVNKGGAPVDGAYFWLSGILSAFLDNAPTYLVFFNLAGGQPETLMGPLASTLTAFSLGSVFMGAMTYIGNAPNFMVKAIAQNHAVQMPSFFGYLAWSCGLLLPLFLILSLILF
ncbi:MAG: sodium:proton antiporter [Proteobacteria bacterium]|nr:sodium:proton antiporter [Pseudomonadota bacterium]